jgi:hypothetical protein
VHDRDDPLDRDILRERLFRDAEDQRRERERDRMQSDFEWRMGQKDSRDGLPPKWNHGPYKLGYDLAGGFRPLGGPFDRKRI